MIERTKFGWGYIFLGALLSLIGICFISFNNSLNTLAICCGVILIVFGVFSGALTLASRDRGLLFGLKIALSVIFIICGTITAIVQTSAVEIIANVFCLLLIIDGSFKLQTAILSKRYRVVSWWIMLALSSVIIVCAFLLAKLSPDSSKVFSVLTGVIVFVDGAANIFSAFYISSYNSNRSIDAYIYEGVDEIEEEVEKEQ